MTLTFMLHRAGDAASLEAVIRRDGGTHTRTVELPRGWRKASDISWRTSSWEYRRIALGGMQLEDLPRRERGRNGLSADRMALRAEYVGQWGKYALAGRSGFEKDDLIISFDGHDEAWKEQDLFFHVLGSRKKGDEIPVTVLRGDRKIELKLLVQD